MVIKSLIQFLLLSVCMTSLNAQDVVPEPASERVLLEQNIIISRHPVAVHVWLEARQFFQQQAVRVHVRADYPNVMRYLSLQASSTADKHWTIPQVTPEPEVKQMANVMQAEWCVILFPKMVGIYSLPRLQLLVEGEGMSRQLLALPEMTLRIMPLPVYVPTEAIVGELLEEQVESTASFLGQVGSIFQRQINLTLKDVMPDDLMLSSIQGEAVTEISPLIQMNQMTWQAQHLVSSWSIWQPWRLQLAGSWSLLPQDLWVFNPETWQVQHVQWSALNGYAIPVWLKNLLLGMAIMIVLLAVLWLLIKLRCYINRRHYIVGIKKTADALQLRDFLIQQWRLSEAIPLAHQTQNLPIFSESIALESLIFSGDLLYGEQFDVNKRAFIEKSQLFHDCNLSFGRFFG
ncbi:MAG: hypothetical protein K0U21_02355 [Proteobacteria bacterium]|nr:hypothetical protein [Pseudomonadota bacterium]